MSPVAVGAAVFVAAMFAQFVLTLTVPMLTAIVQPTKEPRKTVRSTGYEPGVIVLHHACTVNMQLKCNLKRAERYPCLLLMIWKKKHGFKVNRFSIVLLNQFNLFNRIQKFQAHQVWSNLRSQRTRGFVRGQLLTADNIKTSKENNAPSKQNKKLKRCTIKAWK